MSIAMTSVKRMLARNEIYIHAIASHMVGRDRLVEIS